MTASHTQVQATVPTPRPAPAQPSAPLNEGAPRSAPTTRLAARPPTAVSGSDWSPATWLLLVVLCGALFLDALDLSMVGVARMGVLVDELLLLARLDSGRPLGRGAVDLGALARD